VRDNVGNITTQTYTLTGIDRTPPTCSVAYAVGTSVVATLTGCSKPIITGADGGTHTFTGAGTYTFNFVDLAGNPGSATATAQVSACTGLAANAAWNTATSIFQVRSGSSRAPSSTGTYNSSPSATECRFMCAANYLRDGTACVEATMPVCTVTYNITTPTFQNVIATLTGCNMPITVTNNSGSVSRTFTGNGSFIFEFKNSLEVDGNATATTGLALVDWILTTGSLCADVPDITYNGITIKACNVGATHVTGVNSTGFHFQRGNNYGFPSAAPTNSATAVNASAFGPLNPYSSATYIRVNAWDNSNNTNLR